jgi:hypothetical protein
MIGLRTLGVVMATLCAMAAHAQAGCPIALDGDAAVVDHVRAELGRFGDGEPPCVALWVQCRQNGIELEIDLHDELGRSSLHLFTSAGGAAAFLVSWSRRPLLEHGPDAPPGLVEPASPPGPAAVPASPDRLWHPEFGVAYVAASGAHTPWGTATATVMKDAGMWRYGGGGRLLGWWGATITIGVEAVLGVQTAMLPRVTAAVELSAGDGVIIRPVFGSEPAYGNGGLRAGIRARLTWQFIDAFGLELQWGYDAVQSPAGTEPAVTMFRGLAIPAHVALGLRWLP